jgi:Niemann-Pick C1 protein
MFHSTCTQAIAFLFGGMSDMPAVRAFALYAALSLSLNFLMQVTAFVAVMSLDHRRKQANRHDVLCCFVSRAARPADEPGFVQRGFNEYYVPALMSRIGRRVVIVAFLAWTAFSICRIPQINIGLEQEVALPDDSYVLKYLVSLKKYLSVGPPVYFVVNVTDTHFDLSNESAQNLLCGGHGCSQSSLQAHIKQWSRESNVTHVAAPAQSWIDDYFDWFRHCCKSKSGTGEYCDPTSDSANSTKTNASSDYGDYGDYGDFKEEEAKAPVEECLPCDRATKGRPAGEVFWRFLPAFLSENPSKTCPKGGRAAYADAVRVASDNRSVAASSFFTFHTVLRNSDDYIEAMRWSRRLSQIAEDALGGNAHVYAYSIFYVFYEQYLEIVTNTVQSLVISLIAVFITVFILSGMAFFNRTSIEDTHSSTVAALNLTAALITVIIIALVQVNLLG